MTERVLPACAGGLDTSVAIGWTKDEFADGYCRPAVKANALDGFVDGAGRFVGESGVAL